MSAQTLAPTSGDGTAHRRALLTMLICTVLWSLAGVGTRRLERAEGFEIAFWRSGFCAAFVIAAMVVRHRGAGLSHVLGAGPVGWASGVMWAVMFTCFMVALSLTTVANVLVVMAAAPLIAALLGLMEVVLGPLWVWLGAGEAATSSTLQGGALVLAALLLNELVGIRSRKA